MNNRTYPAKRKVLFLVPKVCLAKQQHRKFREYLHGHECGQLTGRQQAEGKQALSLDMMLGAYDVIVMTPQVYL